VQSLNLVCLDALVEKSNELCVAGSGSFALPTRDIDWYRDGLVGSNALTEPEQAE
jgi:hypothetical protein